MLRKILSVFFAMNARPRNDAMLPRRPYISRSDGDLAVVIAEHFTSGTAPTFEYIEEVQSTLREKPALKQAFVEDMLDLYLEMPPAEYPYDPASDVWIMGTDRNLNQKAWRERAAEIRYTQKNRPRPTPPSAEGTVRHSGEYVVSVIVSLYKGGDHIEWFLDNICQQTMMTRCEIIIIDADSPDGEESMIRDYQKVFDNIVYRRFNFRLSVYEAWNVGVGMARGRYLTNANVDDLRRPDSLELQAAALDRFRFVDVVYQDFLYVLEPNMAFADAESFGFKSNVPHVTAASLLASNSPHNAPMWRRTIHDDVGLFDTSFRSAADWQFWIRCLLAGKHFLKINSPHVAYYCNPFGVSTNANTLGFIELKRISNTFGRRLISRHMTSSFQAFADVIGLEADIADDATINYLCGNSRFNIVQDRLKAFAASNGHPFSNQTVSPRENDQKTKLAIDGAVFALATDSESRMWATILGLLATCSELAIVLFDRGRAPVIPGVETIPFPSYTLTNTAADSILIQRLCDDVSANVFLSTLYTTPLTVPSVQILCDMIPEVLRLDLRDRAWQEKALSLHFARRIVCLSQRTQSDLINFYPYLDEKAVYVAPGIDPAVFKPRRPLERNAFRATYGIHNPYFMIVGPRRWQNGHINGGLVFDALKHSAVTEPMDLVCIGGDPIIDRAWSEGLPATVRVYDLHLNEDELASAYSDALALVFPSDYEGFCLPVIEAMACGCPVITTCHAALKEVAGLAATFVAGDDAGALREAMDLHAEPSYRDARIKAGLVQSLPYRREGFADHLARAILAAAGEGRTEGYAAFAASWAHLRGIQADVDWRQVQPA